MSAGIIAITWAKPYLILLLLNVAAYALLLPFSLRPVGEYSSLFYFLFFSFRSYFWVTMALIALSVLNKKAMKLMWASVFIFLSMLVCYIAYLVVLVTVFHQSLD